VVGQQPDLPGRAVEGGGGQVGFAQRRTSDGEGVDRVGLAVAAGAVADMGHQLGRNACDALTGTEKVAFESARQVAAVLDGP
jgi:hypothetical protein